MLLFHPTIPGVTQEVRGSSAVAAWARAGWLKEPPTTKPDQEPDNTDQPGDSAATTKE